MLDDVQLTLDLTEEESAELAQCEQVIREGLQTFYKVGDALLTIKEKRLYRATHKAFEDYLRERWEISRPHAYRMIAAAEVLQNLSPIGDIPSNEAQVRELAKLPSEQRAEAWETIVATAPDGKVTAKHVQTVVEKMKGEAAPDTPNPALDTFFGDNMPLNPRSEEAEDEQEGDAEIGFVPDASVIITFPTDIGVKEDEEDDDELSNAGTRGAGATPPESRAENAAGTGGAEPALVAIAEPSSGESGERAATPTETPASVPSFPVTDRRASASQSPSEPVSGSVDATAPAKAEEAAPAAPASPAARDASPPPVQKTPSAPVAVGTQQTGHVGASVAAVSPAKGSQPLLEAASASGPAGTAVAASTGPPVGCLLPRDEHNWLVQEGLTAAVAIAELRELREAIAARLLASHEGAEPTPDAEPTVAGYVLPPTVEDALQKLTDRNNRNLPQSPVTPQQMLENIILQRAEAAGVLEV